MYKHNPKNKNYTCFSKIHFRCLSKPIQYFQSSQKFRWMDCIFKSWKSTKSIFFQSHHAFFHIVNRTREEEEAKEWINRTLIGSNYVLLPVHHRTALKAFEFECDRSCMAQSCVAVPAIDSFNRYGHATKSLSVHIHGQTNNSNLPHFCKMMLASKSTIFL